MDISQFEGYLASLYGREATDPVVTNAANMAVGAFTSARPWTFCCVDTTKTTDANGIVTFDDDFDGIITMRERISSSGGWIQPWASEKFDFDIPRLDNLTGSYPKVCKIYKSDWVWYGQMAPPVASATIYLTYKQKVTDLTGVPDKYLPGIVAYGNFFMTTPAKPEHQSAAVTMERVVKRLWKEDRKSWAAAFKTLDEAEVRRYVTWWGTWDAWG